MVVSWLLVILIFCWFHYLASTIGSRTIHVELSDPCPLTEKLPVQFNGSGINTVGPNKFVLNGTLRVKQKIEGPIEVS